MFLKVSKNACAEFIQLIEDKQILVGSSCKKLNDMPQPTSLGCNKRINSSREPCSIKIRMPGLLHSEDKQPNTFTFPLDATRGSNSSREPSSTKIRIPGYYTQEDK